MRRLVLAAAVSAMGLAADTSARATTIGTATGDLVVHYNGTGPEVPGNVSYVSTANTVFNFDPGLAFPVPGYGMFHFFQAIPDQFKLDLVYNTPTNTGAAPSPVQASNGNANGTVQHVDADWAITDPTFGSIGNSVLRGGNGDGSSISFTQTVTPTADGFHLDLSGFLTTDGLIHWATSLGSNNDGTSNLNDLFAYLFLPNDGKVYFNGSFDYVTADDVTPGADVYHGTMSFDMHPAAVPVPAAAPAGAVLLGGLALVSAKRRRAAANA